MHICYNNLFQSYISDHSGHSELLLDEFKCHRNQELIDAMEDVNALRLMVAPHYTGLQQLYDFGINKSLKDRLKSLHLIGW